MLLPGTWRARFEHEKLIVGRALPPLRCDKEPRLPDYSLSAAIYLGFLRDMQDALGLSQQELAECMGIGRSTVAKWIQGSAAPRGLNRSRFVEWLQDLPESTETARVWIEPEVQARLHTDATLQGLDVSEYVSLLLDPLDETDVPGGGVRYHTERYADEYARALRDILTSRSYARTVIEKRVADWRQL